jgi:hypothetical protein
MNHPKFSEAPIDRAGRAQADQAHHVFPHVVKDGLLLHDQSACAQSIGAYNQILG